MAFLATYETAIHAEILGNWHIAEIQHSVDAIMELITEAMSMGMFIGSVPFSSLLADSELTTSCRILLTEGFSFPSFGPPSCVSIAKDDNAPSAYCYYWSRIITAR
jgi:hypothetical protein